MSKSSSSPPKLIFSVRLFSEITIKSASVRKRWTKLLAQNIRTLGRQIDERTSVVQDWDRIEVRVPADVLDLRAAFVDLLSRIPGIANFSEVKTYPLVDMHDIFEKTLALWSQKLVGKTFCVRVKRLGNHTFSSGEVERYVGGGLNQHCGTAGVSLKHADETVRIEIKDDLFYISNDKHAGLGGFPLGTQDPVLSLVSGGFDSTVASYQMIARGMRTHFCFFNLGGRAHEIGVKEISYFLWRRYGASHRVKFTTVPFDAVVADILQNISPANMGVVLKRMMFRAANRIAMRAGIQALVTGEAISQVSSQTVPNLALIDKVTDRLVLRPLIASAKPEIIRTARHIGLEHMCASVPEYCGVISVKPSAKVNEANLLEEEAGLTPSLLDEAIAQCSVQVIDQVMQGLDEQAPVTSVSELSSGDTVIDIRHPDEQELKPLTMAGYRVIDIPFYRLSTAFADLDSDKQYFLYCDKGVMSELHAMQLKESGYSNVAVFRPGKVDV